MKPVEVFPSDVGAWGIDGMGLVLLIALLLIAWWLGGWGRA